MKKTILILIITIGIFACKKEDKKEYHVTLIVKGQGNYTYQIGSTKSSGHINGGQQSFSGVCHIGDYADMKATSDSLNPYTMYVEFNCDPTVGVGNVGKNGNPAEVQYHFQ